MSSPHEAVETAARTLIASIRRWEDLLPDQREALRKLEAALEQRETAPEGAFALYLNGAFLDAQLAAPVTFEISEDPNAVGRAHVVLRLSMGVGDLGVALLAMRRPS